MDDGVAKNMKLDYSALSVFYQFWTLVHLTSFVSFLYAMMVECKKLLVTL